MSDFLLHPGPRWFTIPAHRPFLTDLARGVWEAVSPLGPDALAETVILLPTRRAARFLAQAFLEVSRASAVILPQTRALGDLDEGEAPFEPGDIAIDLPPPISEARRRYELAGLIVEHGAFLERTLSAGAALEMADALAGFLDGLQIEECAGREAIADLVPGELARHWQISVEFLQIALEAWPRRLEALGVMDIAARRVALMRRLAARWRDRPPDTVIIAAGSTGSAKAGADLLAAIAAAPRGAVVLPGLDKALADTAWEQVSEQHPQGAMHRLLRTSGVARGDVKDWGPEAETEARGRWRRRVINEALRPPGATADWRKLIGDLRDESAADGRDPIAEGLAGLSVITARTPEEAATVAALLLREALETPGKTAALIAPDAALARRVSARLTRWNISADSSAGQPLAAAAPAVLASLVARFGSDEGDPVTLLAILKHSLTRGGLDPAALSRVRRTVERYGLRGPRPDGWDGLITRLREARTTAINAQPPGEGRVAAISEALEALPKLQDALSLATQPYDDGLAAPSAAATALAEALEALAAGPSGGSGELWAGQGGESLAALLGDLITESGALPQVTPPAFSELIDDLLARQIVRPGGASHPRLRILGVLEARLVRADLLVVAGLEEGSWPRGAPIDPFLSRPMRERLGLPSPERRIGLSAHDFAQAACAPEVVLLRAERRDGAPAVASRWLWRLQTLAAGAKVDLPGRPEILEWARALDAPIKSPPASLKTATRPCPTPPVEARPRRLPVTAVERWVRDPYSVYARSILKLSALDRPDAPVEALARGRAIHAAFERFAIRHPEALPEDAEAVFEALLLEALRDEGMPASRMARERALAAHAASWVIGFERKRRPGARLIVETHGEHSFEAPGGPFIITARADRLEARDGVVDILDFKTGSPPTASMVRVGLSPQLTLTGAILAAGGFADLGPRQPGELLYVQVSGGRVPGEEHARDGGDGPGLAALTLDNLKRRVRHFDNPATGYMAWAMPQFIGQYGGDYDHLARLWEWHVVGGENEG
jgi:ATP-dependent helicase/nuclease subunit B